MQFAQNIIRKKNGNLATRKITAMFQKLYACPATGRKGLMKMAIKTRTISQKVNGNAGAEKIDETSETLSVEDFVSHIKPWGFGVIYNYRDGLKGGAVIFEFDDIALDAKHLIFKRKGCTDKVSFKLKEIKGDVSFDTRGNYAVFFLVLKNGDEWGVSSRRCSVLNEVPEHFVLISAEDIRHRLCGASLIKIISCSPNFTSETYYDSYFCFKNDESGCTTVIFETRKPVSIQCTVDLRGTMRYRLLHDSICTQCNEIRIETKTNPLFSITLTIFCERCAESRFRNWGMGDRGHL